MSSTRTGGRSAIVRAKVLAAASDLVSMKGPQNVTLPEIAQRAGVAATSLYRRWGDVGSLLLDMAVERISHRWPLPDEGTIEDDLKCWTEKIVFGLNSTEEPVFFRVLLATWNVAPEKRIKALAPRIEQLQEMLQRGSARGERIPSIEDIFDRLLSPLYMRALFGLPLDKAFSEHLVEHLLNTLP
jgi:AcrR family transcriptional regulator